MKDERFCKASHVLILAKISPAAKIIYLLIRDFKFMCTINHEPISLRNLMKWTGAKRVSVEKALEELQANFMILVARDGKHGGFTYHCVENSTLINKSDCVDFSILPCRKQHTTVTETAHYCDGNSTDKLPKPCINEDSQRLRHKEKKTKKVKKEQGSIHDAFASFNVCVFVLLRKLSLDQQLALSLREPDKIFLEAELKKMTVWIENNPKKANKKDWDAFIRNWLSRDFNKKSQARPKHINPYENRDLREEDMDMNAINKMCGLA